MEQRGWRRWVKRGVDVCVSGVALGVGAPVILATGCAVRLSMGRPVLFTQDRVGRDGRVFRILKFRSMRDPRSKEHPEPDAERITRVGRFLRASSLDELPQLINVLKGEMSLIGPRPLLVRYLPRYSARQARRHDVLPGLTGWAQVHGRNQSSWDDKFENDVWYVENWSLRLDARILWRTVRTVLVREGVSAADHATMPEFMGATAKS